jgi:sodium-dependent phosphate cotransporter
MGTGFKLLGGKDSAKMFDVVDNPISALMIGILATVLVQSSSTSTSIIISLVGANELSVKVAIFMIMGANIGTSVTNTIVAMGHFASKAELRRGFAAATVHDLFNWLSVCILLPLNWIYPWLEKMTYEMAKSQKPCDEDAGDNCVKQEFIKPYISPYSKGVAQYDKKIAGYVSQGYCKGMCDYSLSKDQLKSVTKAVCAGDATAGYDCSNLNGYEKSWMSSGALYKKRAPQFIVTDADGKGSYAQSCPAETDCDSPVNFFDDSDNAPSTLAANTVYKVCPKFKSGLCDKRLLKGGLMLDDWDMTDEGAGTLATILSLASLCCCLFLIVYCLQILVKGPAARVLRTVVGFNGYLSIAIGCVITILVQSSSITTSTLTPLCAVGLISLEDMFPLTLGANIGTTLTGIMSATVVTSNPVEAWQVALCHFFFNVFGILIFYPVPKMREIPLNGARWLGKMTTRFGPPFPLIYTFVVFFIVPGIVYGITVAATA